MAPRITCPKCGETFAFNLSAVETDAKRFDPEVQLWAIDRGGIRDPETRRLLSAAADRVPPGGLVTMWDVEAAQYGTGKVGEPLGEIQGGAV